MIEQDGASFVLRAPSVGFWRGRPKKGALLGPGSPVGTLVVLGRRTELRVPAGVMGRISEVGATDGVAYGQMLLVVQSDGLSLDDHQADPEGTQGPEGELVLRSPSSGRFWLRPSPDAAPFVTAGQELAEGDPVGLLEVMKTFTRISYSGTGLPPRARVLRVLADDGGDVEAGAALLELEPA